jgi:hypothetical protein
MTTESNIFWKRVENIAGELAVLVKEDSFISILVGKI